MPLKELTTASYFLRNALKSQAPDGVSPIFRVLFGSWRRSLLAENRAPRTMQTYLEALTQLGRFLVERGMPTEIAIIRRDHIEEFTADLIAKGYKPGIAANRYRSLQCFFKWAVEEGEIPDSPMKNMRPPTYRKNRPTC